MLIATKIFCYSNTSGAIHLLGLRNARGMVLGKVLRAGKCYDKNFKGCWARTVTRPKKLSSSEIEHFF